MNFIMENYLILVPVLYVLGMLLKNTEKVSDKYIPIILLVFGVGFACALGGFNINAILQGILVTGATVLTNQVIKQAKKVD